MNACPGSGKRKLELMPQSFGRNAGFQTCCIGELVSHPARPREGQSVLRKGARCGRLRDPLLRGSRGREGPGCRAAMGERGGTVAPSRKVQPKVNSSEPTKGQPGAGRIHAGTPGQLNSPSPGSIQRQTEDTRGVAKVEPSACQCRVRINLGILRGHPKA